MAKAGSAQEVISLPKGGGALHGIGETFSPDLFTGTGNFTVPIALPPGRNGFQPEISLVYSTGNGNGPFGLGWSLSVPGVTRKTSKGVPRYQDAADVFVLSGAEDLVPVDGSLPGDIRYRPRTEGLFAHITFLRGKNCWEVKSKDGLVSLYGDDPDRPVSDPAVLADPAATDRVFAWKLVRTRDTFGNRIDYEYDRDRVETEERHWDQLYLKRIRYVDYNDAAGAERFLISVTFNYEPGALSSIHSAAERPDAFSDYRAGFEIRTRKRCKSILVETHAEKTRLVRSYEFTYLDERSDVGPEDSPRNAVSLLSRIRVVGHDQEQVAIEAQTQELPPLEFRYTRFAPDAQRFFTVEGTDLPTQSLASADLTLVDIIGNGLPHIVEMNGAVRYWRNLGGNRFDLPRSMPDAPAGVGLADPGVQLIDANGDGRIDLLVTSPPLAGYFPMQPGGLWDKRSFQRYETAPSFSLQDPEVALVDLDGDGVTDAIRSGSRLECFFNDPLQGWTSENVRFVPRGVLEEFPNVSFSDQRVRFADMSGDGLQDIVVLYDGNVEYWPNLGHGKWARRLRMANSPRFPHGYDPRRILIGDVDGDGLADLVFVDHGRVLLHINQCGNRWSDAIEIDGTPPVTDVDAVSVVDLLGNGVGGVLWSANAAQPGRPHMFFLDLTGGVKPYLLSEMDNHMGTRTSVEYASSTRFYLEDEKNRATRWKTTLPFPVLIVARVEVVDEFSRGKLTTEYRYHHGYWDGAEREFRGFGRVDQLDTETFDDFHHGLLHSTGSFDDVRPEFFSPPTETRTWFHLGPIGDEFGEWTPEDFSQSMVTEEFSVDDASLLSELQTALPSSLDELAMLGDLPRRVKRDAIRALRGRVIRTELYARDGSIRADRPFTVTERLHGVCGVLDRNDDATLVRNAASLPVEWRQDREAQRIFFAHEIAQRTTQWERGDDPLTRFAFIDDYDAFGQPVRQTQIACPRGWRRLADAFGAEPFLATHSQTDFAAPSSGSSKYIHDRVARVTSFEVKSSGVQRLLALQQAADAGTGLEVIGQGLNFYDGEAFRGRPNGEVGEHGMLIRSESLVLTEDILRKAYKDDTAAPSAPAIPPYLDPAALPVSMPEYPQEFGDFVIGLPGLAGFTFQPGDAVHERGYFASSTRYKFDVQDLSSANRRGVLLTVRDPVGPDPPPGERGSHDTDIRYDEFDLLPAEVIDPAGLATSAKYDLRTLQPRVVTDPNRNQSEFTFSPLGLVQEVFVRGKNPAEGDQTRASTRFAYGFMAFEESAQDERQPIFVRTIRHEHHDTEVDVPLSERDATIETVEYSDGFGRLLQTRTQAEEVLFGDPLFGNDVLPPEQNDAAATQAPVMGQARSPGDPANVVVSGWQIYDNKGRVVEKFEPFFSRGFGYLSPDDEQRLFNRNVFGQKATMFYDPLGRSVRTLSPDGSEQRVIFGVPGSIAAPDLNTPDIFEPTPWSIFTYDANDLAPLSRDPKTSTMLADRAPRHHHFTPSSVEVDALGRTVVAIERDRDAPASRTDLLQPIQGFRTEFVYDIRGNLLTVTDALGRPAFEYVYDLANNALRVQNIDAGIRRTVLNATGNEIERRDKKGALILQAYDVVHRPIRLWARDAANEDLTLRERLIYGDGTDSGLSAAEARAVNLLGALHRHYDEAGLLEFAGNDFKGNVLEKSRRVIRDEAILKVFPDPSDPNPNWDVRAFRVNWEPLAPQEAAQLDDKRYETSVTYDALNRVKTLRYPRDVLLQRKVLQPRYNRAGALESVALDGDVFVERIAYDAKGQRSLMALGNDVLTRYAYDQRTFRLVRLRSERFARPAPDTPTYEPAGTVLQDFAYAYDLAGNIERITDRVPGSGIQDNTDAALIADSALSVLVSAGDALVRRFAYDALYRLKSATGRICKNISRPLPFDENPPWCGFNRPNHGTPNQDNAPNLTERYQETYLYDELGNVLQLKRAADSKSFTRTFAHVDGTNQLKSLTVGNGVSPPPFTCDYDDNGNLAQESTERHFEWDHGNRMRVFRTQVTASEPSVHAHYLYDAAAQRVKKLVRRQGGSIEATTYVDELFEHHAWTRNAGQPGENDRLHIMDQQRIAMVRVGEAHPEDKGPQAQYHLGDHIGSSNLAVDEDRGFINREEHTPYGETSFGSVGRKRYRFNGKERDEESGLCYYGARFHSPWTARWISCDPAEPRDAMSLYLFAAANPVSYTDRNGLQPEHISNLEADLSPAETQELEQFDPNWRWSMGFIEIHGTSPPDHSRIPAFTSETSRFLYYLPGEMLASLYPPTYIDLVTREGPSDIEMARACNRGLPILCMQARDRRLAGQVNRLGRRVTWWADKFVAAATAAMGAGVTLSTIRSASRLIQPVSSVPKTALSGAGAAYEGLEVFAESGGIAFGQATVKSTFAHGPHAGKTVGQVASGLRSGAISPDSLPIEYVVRNGEAIALNNRSLLALRRAGLEPTVTRNLTGDPAAEVLLNRHLRGSPPSDVIRVRGGSPGTSLIE